MVELLIILMKIHRTNGSILLLCYAHNNYSMIHHYTQVMTRLEFWTI